MSLTRFTRMILLTMLAASASACGDSEVVPIGRAGGTSGMSAGGSAVGGIAGSRLASGGVIAHAGDIAGGGLPAQGGYIAGGGLPAQGGNIAGGGQSGLAGVSSVAGAAQTSGVIRSTAPYNENPGVTDQDYAAFIAGTNDFGLDLFRWITPSQNNCVVSPFSAASALAMTYAGARTNTATQMQTVLHDTLPESVYHASFNRLTRELKSRNVAPHATADGVKSVALTPINAVWLQGGYTIESTYLDTLSANYDTGVHLLDFVSDAADARATINQWVAQQTAGKIPDLLPLGAVDRQTRLIISNLLYFYGSWAVPFVAKGSLLGTGTSNGAFHTLAGAAVSVPMMHDTRNMFYAEGENYQLAELVYDGGKVRMTFLLPAADAFEVIRNALSDDWLRQARSKIVFLDTIVTLPKFRFAWGSYSFKAILQALGMTDPFVLPNADFSGIEPSRQLYIGDLHQKTFIGIDEAGTEAAAVSAVVLTGASQSPPVFNVNRPFFFFIRDDSGAILFAGQVVDPTQS